MTFILISAFAGVQMAVFYDGNGLVGYADSFSLTLAKFSIGNIQLANRTDYLIVTICDILSMITLFAFYVHWRIFINN